MEHTNVAVITTDFDTLRIIVDFLEIPTTVNTDIYIHVSIKKYM